MHTLKPIFAKVADIYFLTELYKRNVIKSKNFSFSNGSIDFVQKVMYIIKSLGNKIVKEQEAENYFESIRFSSNTLTVIVSGADLLVRGWNLNTLSNFNLIKFKNFVLGGYIDTVRTEYRNITGGIIQYGGNNSAISFSIDAGKPFRDIGPIGGRNNQVIIKNMQAELDEIINSIFTIQGIILNITDITKTLFKDADTFLIAERDNIRPSEDQFSFLFSPMAILYFLGRYRQYNPGNNISQTFETLYTFIKTCNDENRLDTIKDISKESFLEWWIQYDRDKVNTENISKAFDVLFIQTYIGTFLNCLVDKYINKKEVNFDTARKALLIVDNKKEPVVAPVVVTPVVQATVQMTQPVVNPILTSVRDQFLAQRRG